MKLLAAECHRIAEICAEEAVERIEADVARHPLRYSTPELGENQCDEIRLRLERAFLLALLEVDVAPE